MSWFKTYRDNAMRELYSTNVLGRLKRRSKSGLAALTLAAGMSYLGDYRAEEKPETEAQESKIAFVSARHWNTESYIWEERRDKDGNVISRDGNKEIYIMNSDGTGQLRLTTFPSNVNNVYPSWSPGGKTILFHSIAISQHPITRGDEAWSIYRIGRDGSGLKQVFNNPGLWNHGYPSLSPDGNYMVFASQRAEGMNFITKSDGTKKLVYTVHPRSHNPSWEIYVENYVGEEGKITLMPLWDDMAPHLLTSNPDDNDVAPRWSPDGRNIAFESFTPRQRPFGPKETHIYTMNPDGRYKRKLTDGQSHNMGPSWSPDGKKIAFWKSEGEKRAEIYVMNADGSDPRNLTNHPSSDVFPSYSPDGRKIAFATDRDGNLEIYVMNADGTGLRRLTNNSATDTQPVWSPSLR